MVFIADAPPVTQQDILDQLDNQPAQVQQLNATELADLRGTVDLGNGMVGELVMPPEASDSGELASLSGPMMTAPPEPGDAPVQEPDSGPDATGDQPAGEQEVNTDPVPLTPEEVSAIQSGVASAMLQATASRADIRDNGFEGRPAQIRAEGQEALQSVLLAQDQHGNFRNLEVGVEAVIDQLASGNYHPDHIKNVFDALREGGLDERTVRLVGVEAITRMGERMAPNEAAADGSIEIFDPGKDNRRRINMTLNKMAVATFGRDQDSANAVELAVEARALQFADQQTDAVAHRQVMDAIDKYARNRTIHRGTEGREMQAVFQDEARSFSTQDAAGYASIVATHQARVMEVVEAVPSNENAPQVAIDSVYYKAPAE